MSRAFVKEHDGRDGEDLPDRPISPHQNFVTPEGLALIEAAHDRAHAEHAAALAANDRPSLARAARELRYWAARRASAQLLPPPPDTMQVHFGSTVTIERDDGRRQTFRLVGVDEADPAHGTLAYVAPLARALMGKEVGDAVTVGGAEAEIVEIQ